MFALAEAYGIVDYLQFDASCIRGLSYYTGVLQHTVFDIQVCAHAYIHVWCPLQAQHNPHLLVVRFCLAKENNSMFWKQAVNAANLAHFLYLQQAASLPLAGHLPLMPVPSRTHRASFVIP